MKLTKPAAADLKIFYEDLSLFLINLKYDKLDFRMLVMEYDATNADAASIVWFDSANNKLTKDIFKKKFNLYGDTQIANYFNINEEAAIIESYFPLAGLGANPKSQGFYIIFVFKEKITALLADFLHRYQQQALQYFYSRYALSISEIIETKQDILNDTIRQLVDLDIINALAGLQYERRESNGSIIYVKNRSDAILRIKFSKDIEFSLANIRLLRKLLEMVDKFISLVVFNKKVIGIGTKDTDLRTIQFNGNHKWQMRLSAKETLKFSRGKFFFDRGNNQQISELPKGFILKKYEKAFLLLLEILKQQKHGALLIITDRAGQEVERLSSFERGYAISPIDLSAAENLRLIKNLASIDGAVFIDRQLNCFGAGIILDGIAKSQGSSARGARYNSARCYLDNKTDVPYAAIIFSEDETMDIIVNKY